MKKVQAESALVLAVLLLGAPGARAADAPKKWKDTAEINLTNTTGNSRLSTFGANDLFNYDWERAGLELKGGALSSKSQGKTTAEQYNASEKATRKVTETFYGYEKFGWDKDRFSGILNRYDFSVGAGDELLSTAKDKLISEAGVGYIREERPGSINKFASGRLYGKYTRTLSATANFSQDAEYLRDFNDGRDYRLNAETALVASVSTHISLKASYRWKRVGRPAPGFVKDDTLSGVSLLINY